MHASCRDNLLTYSWQQQSNNGPGGIDLPEVTGPSLVVQSVTSDLRYACTVSDQYNNQKTILFYIRLITPATQTDLDPATTLYLPSDLIEIGDDAFSGLACKAVIIPDNCTKIGARAFENCKDLLYIYIPASVTSIGDDAFRGCDNVYLDYQNEQQYEER